MTWIELITPRVCATGPEPVMAQVSGEHRRCLAQVAAARNAGTRITILDALLEASS
jgi:hypothetical protein